MNNNFLLQAIFESFIDGVLIVSDRGEVIYANRLRQPFGSRNLPDTVV
ncbi:hypothetical protein [Thermoleptolyngbya sp. C42_A2020_037]|nr:hypothetical protein [Thermoleptolyngbya sp. C42_A2020_037]MBF2085613.1 hypothetical protein [Thermoleptolyngbya sp. C42_A2020_037]